MNYDLDGSIQRSVPEFLDILLGMTKGNKGCKGILKHMEYSKSTIVEEDLAKGKYMHDVLVTLIGIHY